MTRSPKSMGSIGPMGPMGNVPPWPVFVDGRVHRDGRASISPEDLGFLLGLSVFDTLLHEDGCIYFVDEHVARLRHGAQELAIPWPPPWDPAEALRATAAALGGRDAALRITLSRGVPGRGPTMVVTTRALAIPADPGVRLWLASYRKLGGDHLESLKSTNRLRNVLAREEAEEHGAWEALLANHDGDLSEGTTSNVFLVSGQRLSTPPLERGCLSGIVREKILESLGARPLVLDDGRRIELDVRRLEIEALAAADEVFLTNTTCRVVPIVEVAGAGTSPRALPGAAGPVTRAVRARVREIERAHREGLARARGGRPAPRRA